MIDHTTIRDNVATGDGGGLYLQASNPVLTSVEIRGNSAREGGGIFAVASAPVITQSVVAANAASSCGGGMVISTASTPYVLNTVFAYNSADNVYRPSNAEGVLYEFDTCDLYNPATLDNHNLIDIEDDNLFVEPGFLTYDEVGQPEDLHLSKDSPLVDAGDELVPDPDGTRSDIGVFGGPAADTWDRDRDGWPDYFWPGTLADAPAGYSSADYDPDDHDPEVP